MMTSHYPTILILLVEDNLADADLVQEYLHTRSPRRFDIHHVTQLTEGLAFLAHTAADVVLLDLSLPDADHDDAVRLIRQQQPSLPIIVLTGLPGESVGALVVEADAEEYPSKGSTTPDELTATIFQAVERRRGQLRLERSNQQLRQLFEDNADGILVLASGDNRVLFANSAAETLFRRPRTALVGHPFELSTTTRETKIAVADAQPRIVEPRVTEIEWDGQSAKVVSLRDITPQRRTEEELRNSETRFRELADHIRDVFWIWDVDRATPRYVSSAYETIWGRPSSQVYDLGCEWADTIHPDDRARVQDAFAKMKTTRAFNEEFQIIRPDGSIRWVYARGFPIQDQASGPTQRVAGIAEDITDRRQLEIQLRHAQKLEAVGRLAAGIAHEINTPAQFVGDNTRFVQQAWTDLSPVLELVKQLPSALRNQHTGELLAAELQSALEAADIEYLCAEIPMALGQALDGVTRVSNIVRAMKEFAHPGQEGKTLVDLNQAIATTITVARSEWKYVADVRTDLCADLPPVPCLAGEINQVLLNLLVNAAHAIDGQVDRPPDSKGTITFSSHHTSGEHVDVRVQDTGHGISPEIQERIFEPFFTTKEVGKGTGQGLAMAYHAVVSKHGGQIWCESTPGEGTTFVVRLPITERAGDEAAA